MSFFCPDKLPLQAHHGTGEGEGYDLDFAVNLNPWGPCPLVRNFLADRESLLTLAYSYPDTDCQVVVKLLSVQHAVSVEQIRLGNGASELLRILLTLLQPRFTIVQFPAYSEYERAALMQGSLVFKLNCDNIWGWQADKLIREAESKKADLCIWCWPNNPTGTAMPVEELLYMAGELNKRDSWLLLDISFAEFMGDISFINKLLLFPNTILLCSMTKFYGLAGLRLGWIMADRQVIEGVRRLQDPWSVNALAQEAALLCLKDEEFAFKSRQKVKTEREFLHYELSRRGWNLSPAQANFIWGRPHQEAVVLRRQLAEKKIRIRRGDDFGFPDCIRLAVGQRDKNLRLLAALDTDDCKDKILTIDSTAKSNTGRV